MKKYFIAIFLILLIDASAFSGSVEVCTGFRYRLYKKSSYNNKVLKGELVTLHRRTGEDMIDGFIYTLAYIPSSEKLTEKQMFELVTDPDKTYRYRIHLMRLGNQRDLYKTLNTRTNVEVEIELTGFKVESEQIVTFRTKKRGEQQYLSDKGIAPSMDSIINMRGCFTIEN